jgi:hypothetical protein
MRRSEALTYPRLPAWSWCPERKPSMTLDETDLAIVLLQAAVSYEAAIVNEEGRPRTGREWSDLHARSIAEARALWQGCLAEAQRMGEEHG